MSDLYEQVSSDQDPLTKILKKIPGFGGYIDREARRAADKILRETIGAQFQELWKRVGNLQQDFANQGELTYLDDLEKSAMKIQTFIDKITGASYGYSGFFDAQKINEDELAKLYEFDNAMLELGDNISRAIDNVETSVGSDGLPAAVRHLVSLSRELVSTYDSRDEVLQAVEV